jgi:hypothetical protein
MTTKTFDHTLPSGETLTYTVTDRGTTLLVEYPEGVDISRFSSEEAYPLAAITADFGPTEAASAWGEEMGTVYEVWPKG